jgi:hypothetical protein
MKNADMPAMPIENTNDFYPGLTKRELFAAMAMQGMMSNANCTFGDADRCASEATRIADALLAELAREVSQ